MVDASDRERIGEARWMLRKLRDEQGFEGLPLIVIGNKIDEKNFMGKEEIFERLSLKEIIGSEVRKISKFWIFKIRVSHFI